MEIIIGREQATRKLLVVKNGQSNLFGLAGSVPMDVSRQHISLTKTGKDTYLLKNLNSDNTTYVNDIAVEQKMVSSRDKIELSESRYLLLWSAVEGPKVETVNISGLRYVWEEYDMADTSLKKQNVNNSLLAGIPMAFSLFGGILSTISEQIRPYAIMFSCCAFTLMIYGLYRRFTFDFIGLQKNLTRQFQRDYVCPKCKNSLGMKDPDLLIGKNCPYCKVKFTES